MSLFPVENISDSFTDKQLEKRKEYMQYIDEHIENVKRAFKHLIEDDWLRNCTDNNITMSIQTMIDNDTISQHDLSKYSDEEFESYRKYFYSVDESEKDEDDFNEAWKHHYQNNSHHPEFWVDEKGNPIDMDIEAIIEMVCDWQAMCYKFGGTLTNYYEENKEEKRQVLTENSTRILEYIIRLYDR